MSNEFSDITHDGLDGRGENLERENQFGGLSTDRGHKVLRGLEIGGLPIGRALPGVVAPFSTVYFNTAVRVELHQGSYHPHAGVNGTVFPLRV